MPGDSLNFTIEGRMKSLPDIQRNWMWNIIIPGIRTVAPQSALLGEEDLIIRCRSFAIPQRSNTPTESDFMGLKQFFPGKPTVGGTVAATFEETEDQRITKVFYEWEQFIFNINPSNPITAGKSKVPLKRLSTKDIFLQMYKYNGEPLDKAIRFVNAWPQSVSEVPMDYGTGASVMYTVTFQYDYWTLFPDTTV